MLEGRGICGSEDNWDVRVFGRCDAVLRSPCEVFAMDRPPGNLICGLRPACAFVVYIFFVARL